jgi:hypothetical protein
MLDFKAIHERSRFHKAALQASPICGCFSCLRTFPPREIKEWCRSDAKDTEKTCAVCPYCSIDAVLASIEVELTPELLEAMQAHWFTPVYCSSMVTLEEARSAKATLQERLGEPPWLRGVGIWKDSAGLHMVKVDVSKESDEVWAAIPQTIDGVRVFFEDVEGAALTQALKSRRKARFFVEMQAGHAAMTPQEREDDAEELALLEYTELPIR